MTQVPTYLPGPEELKARVFERCTNNNKVLDCNTTCGCERRRAIGVLGLGSFVLRFSLCVFLELVKHGTMRVLFGTGGRVVGCFFSYRSSFRVDGTSLVVGGPWGIK